MIGEYAPFTMLGVLHISGLDKAGKSIKYVCVNNERMTLEDGDLDVVAKMKVSSITDARLEDVQTIGLFRKTVPGLVIEYATKSGEKKSLIFQITDKSASAGSALIGRIHSAQEEASTIMEEYKVKGVSFREEAFMELAEINDDWSLSKKEAEEGGYEDEQIFRYEFYPAKVELIPDDNNEVDQNAVAVIVDGEQIGFIPKESALHVRDLLQRKKLKISSEMGGGPYKVLEEDDDGKLSFRNGETMYWASVSIRYKKDE